jgi:hypothetical protein
MGRLQESVTSVSRGEALYPDPSSGKKDRLLNVSA